jgi:hypothetical protein
MDSLKGKTIKINSLGYEVQEHLINLEDNLETVILTRKIKNTSKKPIFLKDLGYRTENDIQHTASEIILAKKELGQKVGKNIDLAVVTTGDKKLEKITIFLIGPDFLNPDKITFEVGLTSNQKIRKNMDTDIFIRQYLLHQEWQNNFIPQSKSKDIFADGENITQDIEEELERLFKEYPFFKKFK